MPTRTVRFPTERTVGKLKVRRPGSLDEWLGEARGTVEVPNGDLWLVAPKGAPFDLRSLEDINPDDLQALSLSDAKVDRDQLWRIGRLVGLETLLLASSDLSDEDLKPLSRLNRVKWLDLSANRIQGPGLENISQMPLEVLIASETSISDSCFKYLEDLKTLDTLSIGFTGLGDEGLKGLGRLTGLRSLSIPKTKITDDGLAALVSLEKLRRLNISGTGVGDDGLKHIARIPHLEAVELGGTRITNEGLGRLRASSSIVSLRITKTSVTDGAIPYLCQLKQLKYISLDGTGISQSGMERLRQMLPHAAVFR